MPRAVCGDADQWVSPSEVRSPNMPSVDSRLEVGAAPDAKCNATGAVAEGAPALKKAMPTSPVSRNGVAPRDVGRWNAISRAE